MRGLLLCYLDRFREGLTEMRAGIAALETMTHDAAVVSSTIRTWFAGALPDAVPESSDSSPPTVAGLDIERISARRTAPLGLGRLLASAGHLSEAMLGSERRFSWLTGAPDLSGGGAAVGFASNDLGIAQAAMGRPAEARESLGRAASIFAHLDHHALVAFARLNELSDVVLTYGATQPVLRRQLAAEAEAALDRTGGALRPGVSPRLAWLGCLILDGRWEDATRILDDIPDPGNAFLRREITAARATLARHRGDRKGAWAEIRALLPAGPQTEPGDVIHQEGLFLQRLAADLCLDAGDLGCTRLARRRTTAGSPGAAVCSGERLGNSPGLASIWRPETWQVPEQPRPMPSCSASAPDQPLIRLTAHRLLGKVETAAKSHQAAEKHLATALSLAADCDVPFERALTLLALAELRLATNRTGEAEQLLNDVRSVCASLGARPTLARVDALAATSTPAGQAASDPFGLTPRELDVLRLLPHGLSNAEIADSLFVSPRTIQTHLTNLYTKLGVGGRAEAIAYAVGHGVA